MKNLTISLILMILSSSIIFAQSNLDIAPNIKKNPNATTFTDDLFEHHFNFPCGDATGEAGIETNGDYIYTSKWNGDKFFCYEIDGIFLGEFSVTGVSNIRDMAYDGTYFYGAAAGTQLFEMDFTGQSGILISTLTAPVATRACAYDAEYDGFWGNNWSDPITLYDRTGNILNQFNCGAFSSYYGFAYLDPSNENPWLYGFAQSGGASQAIIVQIDPETGAETGVTFDAIGYSSTGTGIAGGLAAFDTYAPGWWTILGIIQNETIFGVEGGTAEPPPPNDAGVSEIISPVSGFHLCLEPVVIIAKNFGSDTLPQIEVGFNFNGTGWFNEIIPGPIEPGEEIEYTFTKLTDLSAFGIYTFESCSFILGDTIPQNDCANSLEVTNTAHGCMDYYSIEMYDDYGDGWNGGYVEIFCDSTSLGTFTLETGAGPEYVEFLVYGWGIISCVWTSGGWPYECSYYIYDSFGELVFEDGVGGVEPTGGDIGYSSTVPELDVGISEIISPNNGSNLGDETVTVTIFNIGWEVISNLSVGFSVDNGTMIMETVAGPICYGGSIEYTFTALADLNEGGLHTIEACTFHNGDERPDNDCIDKNIYNSIQINEQTFNLSEGYQFISTSVILSNPDMLVVIEEILNENLDFVRNSQGQTLRKIGPNWVNGIGDWIIEEGYLVKMFAEDSFTIEGEMIDPSTPISVIEGYQFVSYFPEAPMDAIQAFETIIGDDLDFIRNSQGQILRKIGPNWINGIGDCQPTEGYLVKMFADGEIIYPFAARLCGKTIIETE